MAAPTRGIIIRGMMAPTRTRSVTCAQSESLPPELLKAQALLDGRCTGLSMARLSGATSQSQGRLLSNTGPWKREGAQ